MAKIKIVFLDRDTLGDASLSSIESLGELICYPSSKPSEVVQRCQDATIIITNKVVINKEMMDALPSLKLICVSATGTNNVDLVSAKDKGIEVKNVAGYSTNAVAQHTLAIALNFLGKIAFYDAYCKDRNGWAKSQNFNNLDRNLASIEGLKWGIIGLGTIGKRVANIASGFGAEIIYYSTSGANNDANFKQVDLDTLLKTSDIISIHAPLNDKTKALLSKDKLKLLKTDAILINVGRGGIVVEEDVADMLANKAKFYFGSDVLPTEPILASHKLLDVAQDKLLQERLILTPHIAWAYDKAMDILLHKLTQNIKEYVEK